MSGEIGMFRYLTSEFSSSTSSVSVSSDEAGEAPFVRNIRSTDAS
jgi:hypothetical protein